MEFDEYEYLEKTVENNAISAEKEPPANGIRSDDELDQYSARATDARSEENLQLKKSSSRRRSSDEHRSRSSEENGREKRRKEDKERERDRDKSRDRDREMEKETARSRRSRSRSERRRDEDRERSRRSSTSERPRDERDRSRRSRSRSDRYRDEVQRSRRSRSRSERHREEELERSRRSRSRSERYHGDDYDRHRERSSERELRERESRRHKDKKEEAAEPEADPERDQRTVFAYQINLKADERDVYEFFSRAGKVRDVRLIMDRNSRRSKGVGYIEFYDVLSVPMAIALSGQPLLGQPVMVKPSEAEKNLVQSTASAAGGTGPASGVARRLYAGNLPMNITEEQLRLVFEPFGVVELVQLPLDLETRQCKGYGFIQFARLEDARAAQSLNGQLEIAGRTIKVSSVSEHVGMQDAGANTADLDDDEGGLALNAQSRAILMQKLDRSGIVSSVANPLLPTIPTTLPTAAPILGGAAVIPAAPVDPIGPPSECLLLKNMFDPSVETEPDFDLDIKEDVQEECSKFGAIKHIFVDKNSVGFVYLRFDKVASALSAQRALHGRWFAGKMISATFMLPQAYGAKFPGTG